MPSPFTDPEHAELAGRLQRALGEGCEITSLLGRGGFGVVFAARDHTLQRDVAVKVLRPDIAAPMLRERFRREAEAAAALRHPGIIPIYAVGQQDDLSWFVMPRIAGETLRGRLEREGRLPILEARRILVETATALGVAHAAGFVHRDIKPDNILLEGSEGRVVLTDFGIAKSLGGGTGSGEMLTTTGLVLGTPDYMSPEQAGGEGALDARSDIYSLGVVAYQMLTGERPFAGRTPGAILMQQLRSSVPGVTHKRPECPGALALAVDRCLAPARESRWASIEELLTALGRGSRPVLGAMPDRNLERDRSETVRGFRRTAGVCGAAILLAGGVDLARGELLAVPLAAVFGVAFLAARYGTLWVRGYDWRELIGCRNREAAARRLSVRLRDAASEGGVTHPSLVQARSDRAAILRLLAELPRAEREGVGDLPVLIDQAVARIEELAQSIGTSTLEGDERRGAIAGAALTAATQPLGRLLVLIRQYRRGGLLEHDAELRAIAAELRSPGAEWLPGR